MKRRNTRAEMQLLQKKYPFMTEEQIKHLIYLKRQLKERRAKKSFLLRE